MSYLCLMFSVHCETKPSCLFFKIIYQWDRFVVVLKAGSKRPHFCFCSLVNMYVQALAHAHFGFILYSRISIMLLLEKIRNFLVTLINHWITTTKFPNPCFSQTLFSAILKMEKKLTSSQLRNMFLQDFSQYINFQLCLLSCNLSGLEAMVKKPVIVWPKLF